MRPPKTQVSLCVSVTRLFVVRVPEEGLGSQPPTGRENLILSSYGSKWVFAVLMWRRDIIVRVRDGMTKFSGNIQLFLS